jgi:UDP-2-acetamido-2-deoxy-ribo-hexuluronate aminotransferase
MKYEMVDLNGQYRKIKNEVDQAILNVVDQAHYINGPSVSSFTSNLSSFLGGVHVIPCANGTDALQIAMMSLDLSPGDEVIVPGFTYVATAEVIGLLNLVPVIVDVNWNTFNIDVDQIRKAISSKTKAIVPVHLFGQSADMSAIMDIAKEYGLFVIEDVAQAIGAKYLNSSTNELMLGTIGDIGCTSFFPSKNLGCYGDGGAIYTTNEALAQKIKMIANHGQEKKYIHKYIGVNSRLDTIQAAILDVKLKFLNQFNHSRQVAADRYDTFLTGLDDIELPYRDINSTHVFHQYTLKLKEAAKRDLLKEHLSALDISSMVYYPIPLHKQEAYAKISRVIGSMNCTETLCKSVISLPMHTELTESDQIFITDAIKHFFND